MTGQKHTHGYRERLLRAMKEGPRPMSVRQLADELGGNQKKGIPGRYSGHRGTSYGGVRQYTEGKVRNPRVELLRAMAEVLEVRGDYLAFDDGPMTQAEAEARAPAGAIADSRTTRDHGNLDPDPAELEKALLAGLPALSRAGATSWHALADLHGSYVTSLFRTGKLAEPAQEEFVRQRGAADRGDRPKRDRDFAVFVEAQKQAQVEAARSVAEMVGAGAKAAGVDLSHADSWEVDRYIQTTVQALSVLFRPSSGRELRVEAELSRLMSEPKAPKATKKKGGR